MAETVKIVRFHEVGGAEVLQLEDLPLPEPGPGEVRLRVKAMGLNRAECSFRQGRYLVQPTLPSKIGYEASGVVDAVGDGVDPSWVGKITAGKGARLVFDPIGGPGLKKLEAGVFQPKIDRVFKLEEIVEAQRYMEGNEQVGKIVVVV